MPFPDELVHAIPTDVASELLGYLSDAPCSNELRGWLNGLRVQVGDAQAQDALWER